MVPGLSPKRPPDLAGAGGTNGDGEGAPGGVEGLEGPATASEDIAGSDIVEGKNFNRSKRLKNLAK